MCYFLWNVCNLQSLWNVPFSHTGNFEDAFIMIEFWRWRKSDHKTNPYDFSHGNDSHPEVARKNGHYRGSHSCSSSIATLLLYWTFQRDSPPSITFNLSNLDMLLALSKNLSTSGWCSTNPKSSCLFNFFCFLKRGS